MKNNYAIVPKIFTTRPDLALIAAKSFWQKLKAEWIYYRFLPGKATAPGLVTFRITPLCNQACVMCSQRGKTGVLKGDYARKEAEKIVPIRRYMELVDELAAVNPILYVWGGEPFLYPGFMDLAQYMAFKCHAFTVNTNGTFLAEHAERIVRDQWASVYVSLDGVGPVNDAIRGKGTYERVVAGLKCINQEKERQGSPLPYLGIVSTVSNLNYLYIDQVVEKGREWGLTWHMVNLGTYANQLVVDRQKLFMKERFGLEVTSLTGFANGYNEGIDADRFSEILRRIQGMDFGYPIITVPALNPEGIRTYYEHPEIPVRERCICPWMHADIDYNGDVHFCVDYPEYVLGNIKDSNFMDIFNGSRAITFRSALRETAEGIFPGCNRCYQLMLLGKRRPGF